MWSNTPIDASVQQVTKKVMLNVQNARTDCPSVPKFSSNTSQPFDWQNL